MRGELKMENGKWKIMGYGFAIFGVTTHFVGAATCRPQGWLAVGIPFVGAATCRQHT